MVDISSGNKKISITVSSTGNNGNVSTNPDMSMFYTERSKEWAISDKIVNNEDYSSKYYAQKSKEQAQISTEKTEEVVNSGNAAINNINTVENGVITNILNQEVLSIGNVNNTGILQINNIKTEGSKQVTLATNQANIATEKANIATTQAGIATAKTTEVVEIGNTALSNIATAKSNALNEINATVENAEQYAQNALNSANSAALSESDALSYKNSAQESSQTATEQASIAVTNANKAITSATNAKISETNAKTSEVRCEEILSRLGTVIKIKGRVDSVGDLPLGDNLDGDAYLVGVEGLDSYPEYYWYQDHWEFLGTTGTSLTWGLISGDISNQTDLQTALNNKQDKGNYALKSEIPTKTSQLTNDSGFINNDSTFVHKTGNETIAGVKTFSSNPIITGTGININNSNEVVIQKQGTNFLRRTSAGQVVISGKTNAIYLRPNGDKDTTGQLYVAEDGTVTGTKFVGNLTGNVTGNATTSTKATQDSNGNNIINTYATKVELNTKANSSLSNITDAGKQTIKTISQEELNNPYSLFDSKYSDHELNNISWLQSSGQWNDGNVYVDAYNELLTEYNNSESLEETEGSITFKRTPKGYKIALAEQDTAIAAKYTTDGIAWYYILDTENTQFKLPRTKFGFEGLRDKVGDDIAESLPNIIGDIQTFNYTTPETTSGAFQQTTTVTNRSATTGAGAGYQTINFNASRSSITYQDGAPVQERATQMYLYFYVGETVQNANLIDAGRIGEQLASHTAQPHIIETYKNGNSWYRVYSDGWCEQGGYINTTTSNPTFNLLKIFRDTNYTIIACTSRSNICPTRVESNSQFYADFGYGGNTQQGYWQASGYIA